MRSIGQIIETQLRRWDIEQQLLRQEHGIPPGEPVPRRPWIAISREVGAGGEELARTVARLLGFQVFDREIVDTIAAESDFRDATLRMLDERTLSGLTLYVEGMLGGKAAETSDYMRHLLQTVVGIAHHGQVVIVGRGAAFILEPSGGLGVRVVAPLEHRVARVAASDGIPLEAARETVMKIDRERAEWVRRRFGRAIDDPAAYDLVVNTKALGLEAASEVVREALERKLARVDSGRTSGG